MAYIGGFLNVTEVIISGLTVAIPSAVNVSFPKTTVAFTLYLIF